MAAILPNINLKDHEVRDYLNKGGGKTNNSFGSKFKPSADVNKWAFFKPESHPNLFKLSDYERYLNNHGLDVSAATYGTIGDKFGKMGELWAYIPPKGGQDSPFRSADFLGYNDYAVAPFDYHLINKSASSATYPYSEEWRVVLRPNAEIKMSDLAIFDTMNAEYYVFIARKLNGSNYEYIKSTEVSRSGDPTDIICSITFPSEGDWECLFCMGQSTDELIESRTDLIPLPDGNFTFSLSTKYIFVNVVYVSPNPPEVTYDSYERVLNFGTTYFNLTLEASDKDESVPITTLQFGFQMTLLDSMGNELGINAVYSEEGSDEIIYTGTDKVDWMTVNFPQFITLTDYFSEVDIDNASVIRIRPDARVVNGKGIPSVSMVYFDYNLE